MSKFSIFTLFLSVTIIVIVGELLVNQYLKYPEIQEELATNVMNARVESKNAEAATQKVTAAVKLNPQANLDPENSETWTGIASTSETNRKPTDLANSTLNDSASESEQMPNITFSLIQEAGFINTTMQRTPFNGLLFSKVDLGNFKTVPVIKNNLLENNRNQIATFCEFGAGSRMLANEIYAFLKENSSKMTEVTVNETNQFGENSFYVNFASAGTDVFLVVKQGDTVYALTYKKDYHPLVKQLLVLLSKT